MSLWIDGRRSGESWHGAGVDVRDGILADVGDATRMHDDVNVATANRASASDDKNEVLNREKSGGLGFGINLHHTESLWRYRAGVDEIVAIGCDALLVVTPAWQTDGGSVDVRMESGPGRGPTREQLVELLRYGKSRGLRVGLMPTVLFTNPRGNEWRGKLHPAGGDGWALWWLAYRDVIDTFVDIAIEADVDLFVVGSELLSTEKHTGRWLDLIASVRERFAGELTYSTNWDHYHTPKFWDALDAIGVSAYYDLTAGRDNGETDGALDVEKLTERWDGIREDLSQFSQERSKPILLTELGYPSLPWGVKSPWNYVRGENVKATHEVQRLGYEAFIKAFDDLADGPTAQFRGVFFYQWDVYADGGPSDTGYGVAGKPTHGVLKRWLRDGEE